MKYRNISYIGSAEEIFLPFLQQFWIIADLTGELLYFVQDFKKTALPRIKAVPKAVFNVYEFLLLFHKRINFKLHLSEQPVHGRALRVEPVQ
jgi:hypothetical protein